jgi:uncharacterized repeat protein (TIGR01451 family)
VVISSDGTSSPSVRPALILVITLLAIGILSLGGFLVDYSPITGLVTYSALQEVTLDQTVSGSGTIPLDIIGVNQLLLSGYATAPTTIVAQTSQGSFVVGRVSVGSFNEICEETCSMDGARVSGLRYVSEGEVTLDTITHLGVADEIVVQQVVEPVVEEQFIEEPVEEPVVDEPEEEVIQQVVIVPEVNNPLVDIEDDGTFVACLAPRCDVVSSTAGRFVFNVTGFTSHSAVGLTENLTFNITKGGVDTLPNGSIMTYNINVTTLGSGNITNTTIHDFLPPNTVQVGANPANSSAGIWSFGNVTAGSNISLNISVRIGNNLANGTIISNNATLLFQNTTGSTKNTTVQFNTTVSNLVNLSNPFGPCPGSINVNTVLTEDVTSNDTCVIFNASGITLDCAGYQIVYNNDGGNNIYGAHANRKANIAVINCNFLDNTTNGSNGRAIFLEVTNFSRIANNTIFAQGGSSTNAIRLSTSDDVLIEINTITTNSTSTSSTEAIYLTDSPDVNISSNTILGTRFDGGLSLQISSHRVRITSNTIATGPEGFTLQAMDIDSSNDLFIFNNTIRTNGSGGSNHGIKLRSDNTTILNNTIITNGTSGNDGIITGLRAANTTVKGNTILSSGRNGNGNDGIAWTQSASINSTFINNTIRTHGGNAVSISSNAARNFVIANSIVTNGTFSSAGGIFIGQGAHNNTIFSNHIIVNATGSSGISASSTSSGDNNVTNNTIIHVGTNGDGMIFGAGSLNNIAINNRVNVTASGTAGLQLTGFGDRYIGTVISASLRWIDVFSGGHNFTNTTFVNTNGSVNFFENFTVNASGDNILRGNFFIGPNIAQVNTTVFPELNTTATVTVQNVTSALPIIEIDVEDDGSFIDCPSATCQLNFFNGGRASFNVTGFTSYRVRDANITPFGAVPQITNINTVPGITNATFNWSTDQITTTGISCYENVTGALNSTMQITDSSGNFTGDIQPGGSLGTDVRVIGDLDGDGIEDMVATSAKQTGSISGSAYVLFMTRNGTVRGTQEIGAGRGNFTATLGFAPNFGFQATGIGDLNGDGIIDLAISAISDNSGNNSFGAVYILFMNRNGLVQSHQKISNSTGNFTLPFSSQGSSFGTGLANIGDIDGDGLPELAVGARNDPDGGSQRGAVYIISPKSDGVLRRATKISNTSGNFTFPLINATLFGSSVAGIGDLDGDGITEIAVGAIQGNESSFNNETGLGAVYILALNSTGGVRDQARISNLSGNFSDRLEPGGAFGSSVAGIGDLDGDGVLDIIVGSPAYNVNGAFQNNRGGVHILFMNNLTHIQRTVLISNGTVGLTPFNSNAESFGTSVSVFNDLNGDGVQDLVVGSLNTVPASGGDGSINILFMNSANFSNFTTAKAVTNHTTQFSSLAQNTTYRCMILATNTSGTGNQSSRFSFTTSLPGFEQFASLSINKTDNTDPVIPSQVYNYTITVRSNGTQNASNVIVQDILPENVTFISAAPVNVSSNSWSLGNLSPGQIASINISVQVSASAPNSSALINNATAFWTNFSAAQTNTTNESTSVVLSIADCDNLTSNVMLTKNVISNHTCFRASASNIVIDCDGHQIGYDKAGSDLSSAIAANDVSGVTIRDCVFVDLNTSAIGGSADRAAINFTNVNNSQISNVTIFVNSTKTSYSGLHHLADANTRSPDNTLLVNGLNVTRRVGNPNNGILATAGGLQLIGSSISANGTGISLALGNHTINNSNVSNNVNSGTATFGITLNSASNVTIENTRIHHNGSTARNVGFFISMLAKNVSLRDTSIVVDGGASINRGFAIDDAAALGDVDEITFINTSIEMRGAPDSIAMELKDVGRVTSTGLTIFENTTRGYGIRFNRVQNTSFNDTEITTEQNWIYDLHGLGLSPLNTTHDFNNLTFRDSATGKLQITGRVIINETTNISSKHVIVGFNSTFVNSTNLSMLNQSANLTFEGIQLVDAILRKDIEDDGTGITCTDCTELSEIGQQYVVNVTSFTTYFLGPGFTISQCQNIAGPGDTFVLNQTITSTGSCLNITSDNVTVDCQTNEIQYDSSGSGSAFGVRSAEVNGLVLRNCVIRDVNSSGTGGAGINLSLSNSTTLQNNTIYSNATLNGYAISITNSNNSSITSSHLITGTGGDGNDGMDLRNASNVVFSGGTIVASGSPDANGILMQGNSRNNVLQTSQINATTGISVFRGGLNLSVLNNTIRVSNQNQGALGFVLQDGPDNSLFENNEVIANSTHNVGARAILSSTPSNPSTVSNNVFRNNIFTTHANFSSDSIQLAQRAHNNTFINTVFNIFAPGAGAFIMLSDANDTRFFNTTLNNTPAYFRVFGDDTNFTNTTILKRNDTQEIARMVFPGTLEINITTIVNASVLNASTNFAFADASTIGILNDSADITFFGIVATSPSLLVDVDDDGTFTNCQSSRCNQISFVGQTFKFNVTGFTSYSLNLPIQLSSCANLTQGGTTYTLAQDIRGNGTCLNVQANNVTIDCATSRIEYDASGAGEVGGIVSNGVNDLTVRNCIINDVNSSGILSPGINVTKSNNTVFDNNTIFTNSTQTGYGFAFARSQDSIATNNRVTTGSTGTLNIGLNVNNMSNLQYSGGYVVVTTTSNARGLEVIGPSENNTFRDLAINATLGAFFHLGSDNNSIINATIRVENVDGAANGLVLQDGANNNHFENISLSANGTTVFGSSGIDITTPILSALTVSNNSFSGLNIFVRGNETPRGILMQQRSFNNSFSDITLNVVGTRGRGISLSNQPNRTRFTNIVFNGTEHWIRSFGANNTNFTNTTFIGRNSTGELGRINYPGLLVLNQSVDLNRTTLNITTNLSTANPGVIPMLNATADITFNGITLPGAIPLIDVASNGNFATCSASRCTAQSFANGVFKFNVTGFSSYAAGQEIINCGIINKSVILSQDISSDNTCLDVRASNITIDCNGRRVTYNRLGTSVAHGVNISGFNNVTVKNCRIRDINASGSNGHGINAFFSNNSFLLNNTIWANGTTNSFAILASGVSVGVHPIVGTRIINNTLFTNNSGSIGFAISHQAANHSLIEGNVLRPYAMGSSASGIRMLLSQNANITFNNNTVITRGETDQNYGMEISTGGGMLISNNSFDVNATSSVAGIGFFANSENNTIENNVFLVRISNQSKTVGSAALFANGLVDSVVRHNRFIATNETDWIFGILNRTNLTNNTFEFSEGKIRLIGTSTISEFIKLNKSDLNLSFNKTFVNTSRFPALNVSSQITHFNVTLVNPQISRDANDNGNFVACVASSCSLESFTGGTAVYNVSGFTTYMVEESPTPNPQLSVTKLDSVDPVLNGSLLNYTVQINNTGTFRAGELNITDVLPANVTFVNASVSNVSATEFIVGNVSNGSSNNVTIQVVVAPGLLNGTLLTNNVTVKFLNSTNGSSSTTAQENTSVQGALLITSCGNYTTDLILGSTLVSNGTCLTVTGHGVTVRCNGNEIRYDVAGTDNSSAIAVIDSNSTVVRDCVITDMNFSRLGGSGSHLHAAINYTRSNESLIINNTVQTNSTSSQHMGMYFDRSTNATITDNTIFTKNSSLSDGIRVTNNSLIERNSIIASGQNKIVRGVYVSGANVTVRNNTILANGSSVNGVLVIGANNTVIDRNVIVVNGTTIISAIASTGSSGTLLIQNNTITSTGTADRHIGINLQPGPGIVSVLRNRIFTEGTFLNSGLLMNGGVDAIVEFNNITATGPQSYAIFSANGDNSTFAHNELHASEEWMFFGGGVNVRGHRYNFTNTTFWTENGTIRFPSNFSINGSLNISQKRLNISQNRTFLNGTNLSALNTTATIMLTNVTIAGAVAGVDLQDNGAFGVCLPSRCTSQSLTAGRLAFTTTGFTSYAGVPPDVANPVIVVSKTESSDPVNAGDLLNYTILVNNTGTFNAANVSILEILPANVTFVNASIANSSGPRFVIGNITNGSNVTVRVQVRVNTLAQNGSSLNNTVNISYFNASNATKMSNTSEGTTVVGSLVTSSCGNITANTTLATTVNSTGGCFQITSNNVDINCEGNEIRYDSAGSGKVSGINASGLIGLTVRNCVIIDVNASGENSSALHIVGATGGLLINNTLVGNASFNGTGLFVDGGVSVNITNNIVEAAGPKSYAIQNGLGAGAVFNRTTLRNSTHWITGSLGTYINTSFTTRFGAIKFLGSFTLPLLAEVNSTDLNITNNRAFVNASSNRTDNLTVLNQTAEIELTGITLTNPGPQVDFEDDGSYVTCNAPQCTELGFSGKRFRFNVSSFTSYQSIETAAIAGGGGGSSGGGGGGFCRPSWSCTDYSDCIGFAKRRICTDDRSCGTVVNKPVETALCFPGPVQDTCSDELQNQDETGVDCGGSVCQPCPPPIPPTCIDGIQNQDETGSDCGGSKCIPCAPPAPGPSCSDFTQNQGEEEVDCGGPCPSCLPSVQQPLAPTGSGWCIFGQVLGICSTTWLVMILLLALAGVLVKRGRPRGFVQ